MNSTIRDIRLNPNLQTESSTNSARFDPPINLQIFIDPIMEKTKAGTQSGYTLISPYAHSNRRNLNVKKLALSLLSLSQMTGHGQFNPHIRGPSTVIKPAADSEFLALVLRRNIPYPPHVIDCSGAEFTKPRPWETQHSVCVIDPAPTLTAEQTPPPKPKRKRVRARKLTTKKARREALQKLVDKTRTGKTYSAEPGTSWPRARKVETTITVA